MTNSKYKFPVFETLELTTELQNYNEPYKSLTPVKTGDRITGLTQYEPFKQQSGYLENITSQQHHLPAPQLKKSQIIYFYSSHWGQTSLSHLKQLNAIRHELKYHDGNLLIIDADGSNNVLKQTLWVNNLQLPVYADHDNGIANLFKIYSDQSPAWSRYSGLNVNVPLPSVFVLNHYLQVIFDFSNEEILYFLPTEDITNTISQANNYLAGKKTA